MTSGRAPEAGTGAILRALGSLIAALGDNGEGRAALIAEADRATARAVEGFARYVPERVSDYAPDYPSGRDARAEQAALLLSEARERAQRLLDDSVRRANDLLYRGGRESGGASDAALEPLQRSTQELVHAVHDIQQRLDRIEVLLGVRAAARPPVEEPERRSGLSVVPPESSMPPAAPRPAAPAGLPASAAPPPRPSAQPAYVPPPPGAPRPAGQPEPGQPAPEEPSLPPRGGPSASPWSRR